MEKAFNIIKRKNTDNPKKTYEYAVGILEGIQFRDLQLLEEASKDSNRRRCQ